MPASDGEVAARINLTPEKLADLKRRRSVTNLDICTMPEKSYRRMMARLETPKPDHPGEWASFRALQRRGSGGLVKPDGLINGLHQRHELLAQQAARFAAEGVKPEAAGISSASWAELGPGNIGGRIRAMAIHPLNTSTIFIGSVSGGIWKSTNGGASWQAVNDFMGNLSVSSIVIDPANPSVMYAGTGEGFYNSDAVRGYGVFKSVDGGTTWNQLPSTVPSADKNNPAYSWFYVNRLAIAADGTLLAATGGYYGNAGRIWRSVDGGATWTGTYTNRVLDVRFDPTDSSRALAAALGYNATTKVWESHIVRSVNGGGSWTPVKTFPDYGRIELGYSRSNPQIVYASRDNSQGEIWRSADGGLSWTLTATPGHLGEQGWYDNTVWVDPVNPDHLLAGGIDLYRSVDSGTTWTKISTWYFEPSSPHADHHIIVSDPGYDGGGNSRVYVGNDGGIYKADNIKSVNANSSSNGWTNLNNGLAITQFYGAAGSAATGRVYGGTQDNGSLLQPQNGTSWSRVFGGDGGYSAVDTSGSYLFGEYVYLRLHRSTNGGATEANYIDAGLGDANDSSAANFIAPFILDPNNDNTLLAGGSSLWRSSNAKGATPSWSAIKSPATDNISAIAVRQGDPGLIWVGHNDGRLFRTFNGTTALPTWSEMGVGKTPQNRMVTRILVDKGDANLVYVAYGGYETNNLYRTTDGGTTWQNIHGNLPAVPVFTITNHPSKASWLYAGTEVGLFTSIDGGTTWNTSNDGPANVEISELFWLDDVTLVAATHGRGVYRATVLTGDQTPVNGVCGSSDGKSFVSVPSENLCSSGTPSVVSGSGPWNWTCIGQYGGTTSNCSAEKLIQVLITSKPLTKDLAYKGAKKKLTFTSPNATLTEIVQSISAPSWVNVDTTSVTLAKGKGSLAFSVPPNGSIERLTGTITVGSASYAVAQAGTPCKILSVTTQSNGVFKAPVPKAGGVSVVTVDVFPQACSWKISSPTVTPCVAGQEQACLSAWFSDQGNYPLAGQALSGDRTLSGTVAPTGVARTFKGAVELVTPGSKGVKKFSIKQLAK
jgi:hypothetical protein